MNTPLTIITRNLDPKYCDIMDKDRVIATCWNKPGDDGKEALEYARKFAAVDEMLEALQNIISNLDSGAFQITVLDDGEPHPGNLDGVRELIQKATGEA